MGTAVECNRSLLLEQPQATVPSVGNEPEERLARSPLKSADHCHGQPTIARGAVAAMAASSRLSSSMRGQSSSILSL